jgi:methionyl-tRNA formyltransferase
MRAPAGQTATLFMGSGAFAVPILRALGGSPDVRLAGIVTAPPRAAGRAATLRETPVAEAASAATPSVPVLTPTRLRDEATRTAIATLAPDLIVLADYGRLVPGAVLDLPTHGALNLHPSLLPRHRGASPIPAAILAGDPETGVSLIRMDEGLDSGPIVATARMPLAGDEVASELEPRLAAVAADLLVATLPDWIAGRLPAVPQDHARATLTRPLRREDGWLDPARPAVELERQVRAYQPWPGSFLDDRGTRLIVWRASVVDGRPGGGAEGEPTRVGQVDPDGDALALVTVDGRLRLDEVQPAGRARMSGAAYRRGRR